MGNMHFSSRHTEEWVELHIEGMVARKPYHISNYGRIKSFAKSPEGRLLKTNNFDGYPAISVRLKDRKSTVRYIHKLVAQHFIEGKRADQQFVIHLDFDKQNNYVANLQWASKEELEKHLSKNPNKKIVYGNRNYSKLSETEVIRLKKRIFDPNRKTRLKLLAKEFGISEMQLYRIKRGENWASVGYNPLKDGKKQ